MTLGHTSQGPTALITDSSESAQITQTPKPSLDSKPKLKDEVIRKTRRLLQLRFRSLGFRVIHNTLALDAISHHRASRQALEATPWREDGHVSPKAGAR